ncbi:hypothetical protein VKT23_016212 [Stygiomarasmius scandens]|uniref:Xaa-Pro dipeptidyl-peptidase C-terminal domain-containing protein n=1 Tax=Marasmiellus scandens TaxID=2682957 RepID=A0ABR1IVP3_9AGAR
MQNLRIWHHLTSTVGFDTRVFRRKRLDVSVGWKEIPEVNGALDFILPQTGAYKGRVVEFSDDGKNGWTEDPLQIELYSRNSQQILFFPGLQLYATSTPSYPRVDGSDGRFDPTKNPLYFDSNHPYYPFITRSDNCPLNPNALESVPPFLVWKSAKFPEYKMGTIQGDYLCRVHERAFQLQRRVAAISLSEGAHSWPGFLSSQPSRPTSISLDGDMLFDDFVDRLSGLQRWIKELEAWIHMGELLMKFDLEPSSVMANSLTLADDSLMGVWINGMVEHQAAWLASIGKVPLFISHKIEGSKDYPEAIATLGVNDPFSFTAWTNNEVTQGWAQITRTQLSNIVSECSFNYASQKAWPNSQSALKNWNSSSRATDQNFPGIDMRKNLIDEPVEGQDQFGPKPWLTEELSPLRVAWIVPPKVQNPSQDGKWEDFEEITDFKTDRQVLRRLGKKSKKGLDGSLCLYFDRKRKRRLHLEDKLHIPPGICHDIGVFGLPGPTTLYFLDHDLKFRTTASDWVYLQEKPVLSDVGGKATTPPLNSLPLLSPNTSTVTIEPTSELPPLSLMTTDPVINDEAVIVETASPVENSQPNQPMEDFSTEKPTSREVHTGDKDVVMTSAETVSSTEGLKRKRSPSSPIEEDQE